MQDWFITIFKMARLNLGPSARPKGHAGDVTREVWRDLGSQSEMGGQSPLWDEPMGGFGGLSFVLGEPMVFCLMCLTVELHLLLYACLSSLQVCFFYPLLTFLTGNKVSSTKNS